MAEETIQCWSCGTQMTLGELASNDGDCPECEVEIALADYLAKALAENAALHAQLHSLQGAGEAVEVVAHLSNKHMLGLTFQKEIEGSEPLMTVAQHRRILVAATHPAGLVVDPNVVPVRREDLEVLHVLLKTINRSYSRDYGLGLVRQLLADSEGVKKS